MGKASAPKRGRGKARPLRSDSQSTSGMPTIALGKNPKKGKLKPVLSKKGKVKLKAAKRKTTFSLESGYEPDSTVVRPEKTLSLISRPKSHSLISRPESHSLVSRPERSSLISRPKRPKNAATDNEASTSKSPDDSPDSSNSKRQKASKASLDRAESPATTRLSRSSSSSSVAGKAPDVKKTGKGKGKSPVTSPANKGILDFFKKVSPPSKGPTGNKKTSLKSKKELVPASSKKVKASVENSSPESIASDSSQSNQVSSEVNDDDLSVPDDAESCIESHAKDLASQGSSSDSISKSVNGTGDEKIVPKLTKKNISELFPVDDSAVRLRSGSPASQNSTRSLTILRSSPKASSVSSLRSTTRSDSAVRPLRNGLPNKLKRSSLYENLLSDTSKRKKKKKRVYAGLVNKDEDKLDDSRSDISDEQSSIFSESDSSSFIDTFSRIKNSEMDAEDVAGSLSNDDEDMIERVGSPFVKSDGSKGKSISDEIVGGKDSYLKKKEILNHIQSDWDSDGENREDGGDACDPESPFGESSTNSTFPQMNDEKSTKDAPSEKTDSSQPNDKEVQLVDRSEKKEETESNPPNISSELDENSKTESLTSSQKPLTDAEAQPQDPSNPESTLPEPIVLKTNESKNVFDETVDFVSKKNTRIDFGLLRRCTKRSMSFNTDVPEKSQSQRILSVEPSKLHGIPTLLWTVKAVREPIIPKTPKSPEKGLNKNDSQENRNVSAVKPMMESTQNDQISTTPKVASEAVLAPFPVNSSSIKENILVPTSPKQSPGKSPIRDSVGSGGAPKPVTNASKATSEVKSDGPVNGSLGKEKASITSPKQPQQSTLDSTFAVTVRQPLLNEHSSMASKTASVASGDAFSSIPSSATAMQPAGNESSVGNDPVGLPIMEKHTPTGETATERCSTPVNNSPALQRDLELTPDRSFVDDGESFCLRLSPSPTKDERQLNVSASSISSARESSSPLKPATDQEDPKLPSEEEEEHESMDIDEDLETRLLEGNKLTTDGKEKNNRDSVSEQRSVVCSSKQNADEEDSESKQIIEDEVLNQINDDNLSNPTIGDSSSKEVGEVGLNKQVDEDGLSKQVGKDDLSKQASENGLSKQISEDSVSKPETQSLQLVIKKKGPGRPRSHSADSAFINETWVVKNDIRPSSPPKEKDECKLDGKENIPEGGQDGMKDMEMETISDTEKLKEANVINDSSSSMTVECPNVQVKQPGLLSPRLEADVERLNLELKDIEKKRREITEEEQSPEKRAIKEWILSSLGLQSVSAAAAAASNRQSKRRSQDGLAPSSGRLKAVIKVPKDSKRDKKNKPLRMVFKNGKPNPGGLEEFSIAGRYPEYDASLEYTAVSDVTSSSALLNGPEFGAVGEVSVPLEADGKAKTGANLVIPEKSSSFSIHPGRLCSDVCSYCFGKFGSLDTPCHVAQLKSRERQMKIMSVETHLALDSCLCDACIRYVDRKANCPSSSKPQTSHRKDSKSKFEGSMATCSVTACVQPARHSLRKKWYIKIRKSVMKKCPIDLELAHQHLPLPLCPEHFSYLEYFMSCGLCKRRLSKSHMYNLTNTSEINICLEHDGIPARLSDKLFVCKLCRYYATLRVKHTGSSLSPNQREFFTSYRKRILLCHDIDVSEGEDDGTADPEIPNEEQEETPTVSGATSANSTSTEDNLPKGKRKRSGSNATLSGEVDSADQPKKKSRSSDLSSKSKEKTETVVKSTSRTQSREHEIVPSVTISVGETSKASSSKSQKSSKPAKSKQDSDSSAMEFVRKGLPPFYPGEDELALHGKFQFQFDDEPSANRAWEKCTSTLQFDKDTKKLWQELQRPYGSQSSFLRHLVLMERYWRQGELVLAPQATAKATSYTRSVQNRLNAYGSTITVQAAPEAVPAVAKPAQTSTSSPSQAPSQTVTPSRPPTLPGTPSQAPAKAPTPASLPASKPPAPVEAVKGLPVRGKQDKGLALTGGTVLTAADAAAAVTAVHLVSSPVSLPSPSGEAGQTRATQATPFAPLKIRLAPGKTKKKQSKGVVAKVHTQPKPQAKPQPASQSAAQAAPQPKPQPPSQTTPQPTIQVKPMATLQATQSGLQVSAVAPQAVKTPSAIRLTVKTPTSVQDGAQVSKPQVAVSSAHSIIAIPPVSVSSGVTITAEPALKSPPEKQQSVLGKLQPILPKPSSGAVLKSSSPTSAYQVGVRPNNGNSWDSAASTCRPQFISLSSAPVVNLTRSISLTAVPSSPPSVPDLHPINSQNIRPNRSPSTALPSSTTVTSSRASPGSYVSIIPTSPSKAVYSKPGPQSLNMSASITPIYTSQSLPSPVSVTSSVPSNLPAPSPPVANSDTKSATQQQGKVHVTAGGKSFSLTIQQFKKLQALRQQRQLEQKKSQSVKRLKEKRQSSTATSSVAPHNHKDDLEVVEVHDVQRSSLPTISAVCSGDQAKAMWNDESRNSESDSSVSITVEPVDILSKSEIPVENLPKLPKALTVTQIRKESPPMPKAVSASGVSVTITRKNCQSPVTPQMSSPALDIFPS